VSNDKEINIDILVKTKNSSKNKKNVDVQINNNNKQKISFKNVVMILINNDVDVFKIVKNDEKHVQVAKNKKCTNAIKYVKIMINDNNNVTINDQKVADDKIDIKNKLFD
jgi:hypothetical protein